MSDKSSSSGNDMPDASDAPAEPSDSGTPAGKGSSGSASSSAGSVPPEKAPLSSTGHEDSTGHEEETDSPAAGLKGLQEGEEDERRGLLARSKRLQSLLTSNRPLGVRNLAWATVTVLGVIAALLAATGRIGPVTQSIAGTFAGNSASSPSLSEQESLEEVAETGAGDDGTFTFAQLTGHPDEALAPYFSGAIASSGQDSTDRAALIRAFRDLADQYVKRYGKDDNFSMRVSSGGKKDTLLEVFAFEEEREEYVEAGRPVDYDWGRINQMRRTKTRDLVDKWVARGVPEDPIRVKWGMADITRGARVRDEPFVEYEVRLARYLGKSLLMTEIGTKETFNQDDLVSSVDAKSRYQLMPSLLSAYGINRYRLSTSAGNSILVAEEQHPLITMEPSFKHATASINAMGHEIPGISAYHTGVNNIYNEVLVKFLENGQDYIFPGLTTADAYIWGVTIGFPIVSRNSSFGDFSRTYVPGAYGALKAAEETVIDTSQTMLADRMSLAEGQSISLSDLLTTIAENSSGLHWNAPDSLSLYQRFRQMNKHFHLPAGPDARPDSGQAVAVGVPERGNVEITATVQGKPVRFFLPPGARALLKSNGHAGLIDESSVFQFNHDTYADPGSGMRTKYDRQYDQLVSKIRRFGFTEENRQQLKDLSETFEQLAVSEPTHYRRTMADIINKHLRFWQYPGWGNVQQATRAVLGRNPVEPQDPQQIPTGPVDPSGDVNAGAGP
ncbi:MAG: hypothetical protein BRD48_07520 [Bacteroidetes bacterium QS_9_68_14]|nr:MAG: hypothetical protein BRD48_07520 [Bacteroidetes bacterium QS_9_68_14]